MATFTVLFCLERNTSQRPGRREGDRPLAQWLFAWKCLHSATQRAPAHSGALRNALDAGRVTGHSHSAFLLRNAYILPSRKLRRTPAHFATPWTRGG